MSAFTSATDVDATVDVDLTLTPQCEHSQHAERHPGDEPAALLVMKHCPGCGGRRRYLLCHPGWVRMTRETCYCADCDWTGRAVESVTVVTWL